MIRRSAIAATAAVLLSLVTHVFGLGIRVDAERPHADAPSDSVALGSSFEDIAEALSDPVPPEPAPAPEPPTEPLPEPENQDPPTSVALVASPDPQPVAAPDLGSAETVQADAAGSTEPKPAEIPKPEAVSTPNGEDGSATEAASPSAVEPVSSPEEPESAPVSDVAAVDTAATEPSNAPSPEPTQRLAALPVEVSPTLPVSPSPEPATIPVIPLEQESIDPATPDTDIAPVPETAEDGLGGTELAVVSSPRPKLPDRRPSAPSTAGSGSRPPAPQTMESPLTAYQRDGTLNGWLGQNRDRGPGNASTTNYAGRVLVHLNSVPPVRVSTPGLARVTFEINPDGTLAWVKVDTRSGSPELVRAARQQVRKAEPFPRPPAGAKRQIGFVFGSK
ncbi:outer membrane transport energization protein TonB [Aliiruegeria haliotis]|uniref:Outer membrane transport energization protein TonB n=1 Tax=Aliiruegeria haliotis TaxID=1280846 RepID=A0A2T0RPM0_9RHOB|nr:energy transducer TonB [Aliiruegeria haliotis]PRY23136.1 outer membrane transport energization protein TonB [Aliiruegeria haliotis]